MSCTCNEAMSATCAEVQSSDTEFGTISDGNFTVLRYSDNAHCEWLITADSESEISLTFTYFDTESCCDHVTVNECQSPSCSASEQIARLSGSIQPQCPSGLFYDSGAAVCVDFCPLGSLEFNVDGALGCYSCPNQLASTPSGQRQSTGSHRQAQRGPETFILSPQNA